MWCEMEMAQAGPSQTQIFWHTTRQREERKTCFLQDGNSPVHPPTRALACLLSICINYLVISSFNCFPTLRISLAALLCIHRQPYYHSCHWSLFQSCAYHLASSSLSECKLDDTHTTCLLLIQYTGWQCHPKWRLIVCSE